jgi:hypothetical protein
MSAELLVPVLLRPGLLIVAGSGLMVVGAGMLWVSRTRAGTRGRTRLGIRRRRARRLGPMGGRSGALVGAGCVGGAIAGVQWLVVTTAIPSVAPSATAMLVLGVPGFLAGATVVRLLAVIAIVLHRRRRMPAGRRRGGRR